MGRFPPRMRSPPLHPREPERLGVLRDHRILDTPSEPVFDDLVEMARDALQVPMALVSLVDEGRQWFKAACGIDAQETPRDISFCGHAILREELLEIQDARLHPEFAGNPLVTGPPHIRFYAGQPLFSSEGLPLGTLCVIDVQPRTLSPRDRNLLQVLARQAQANLDLRRKTFALEAAVRRTEEVARSRMEFVATVSHEIRTPMNGVLGLAELLVNEPLEAEAKELAEGLHQCSLSLLQILNDVLDLSKLDSERLELDVQPFSLRELLEQVVGLFTGVAAPKGVALTWRADPSIPDRLLGDSHRLRQILANLVGNAVKFTELGSVNLACIRSETGPVRFLVEDSGPGIPQALQSRLFEPWTQAGQSTARQHGGSGLGLAICRRLAELMEGTLEVQSQVGQGSTFELTVPLPAATPVAKDPPASAVEASPSVALRVVVADDDPINRKVAASMLSRLGCRVMTVESGLQALAATAAENPDVVFLDLNMPHMDGLEAARRLKAGPHPPRVLGWTASSLDADRRAGMEAGMEQVLVKPVGSKELWAALVRDRQAQPSEAASKS